MSIETKAATTAQVVNGTSPNWCGYMITGPQGAFQSASATWQVPQPQAGPGDEYYTLATIWVGLNGSLVNPMCLTQAGIDVNDYKDPGQPPVPEYEGWYELELNNNTGDIKLDSTRYPVSVGNTITCLITYLGGLTFNINLHNATRNWTFQGNFDYPNGTQPPAMNSAEIIVESPVMAAVNQTGKLTNFGTVTFQNVLVNGQPIGNFANQATALTMLNNTTQPPTGTNLLASPGQLNGNSFSVTWHNFGTLR